MGMKKMIFVIGVALIFMASAINAWAQIKPGSITLTPYIGGYVFEGNQNLEDEITYGLGLGYNFDEHWGTEAVFNYIDTESEAGDGDVDGKLYRLDGLYYFSPSQGLIPYVAAGIGGLTLNPDRGSSDSDFICNYGGGLKYFFNENMALRGDVRHVLSFPDNNLIYTLGLTFFFGGEKKVAAEPRKDSDGDGVYDDMDRCPGTPAGVKVDNSGCPLDSDDDGVYDYLDKCPDTPAGVKADSSGCPLDSDGDGVYDDRDQCPGTPKGATVDKRGCWAFTGVVLFGHDRSDIRPEAYPLLDNAADILKQNPEIRVEIQGHTDNTGSDAYNQRLSERRAKAIIDYLVKMGIDSDRLVAKGYGESKPVATNETEEGRQENRRVQLKRLP